jgi:RNA ligase (TIGR02306 family)
MNSTHKTEVVRIKLMPHPNADLLEVAQVWGYTCCVKKGDFQDGQLAAYVTPDSLVPVDRPGFAFLAPKAKDGRARIRTMKLRGVTSQGLLIPAPPSSAEGDDVASLLDITHYEPPEPRHGHSNIPSGPPVEGPLVPVYDLESWYRYGHLFHEGERVVVTEKIHGTNVRVAFDGEKLHVGSRRQWKAPAENCIYRRALARDPFIEEALRANPNVVMYGEVFGDVQDLKYGHGPGVVSVVFFDCFKDGRFLSPGEHWFDNLYDQLPHPPTLYVGPYEEATIRALISGKTNAGGDHVSEGIVIEPTEGRWTMECGRLKLKAVNPEYLSRAQ